MSDPDVRKRIKKLLLSSRPTGPPSPTDAPTDVIRKTPGGDPRGVNVHATPQPPQQPPQQPQQTGFGLVFERRTPEEQRALSKGFITHLPQTGFDTGLDVFAGTAGSTDAVAPEPFKTQAQLDAEERRRREKLWPGGRTALMEMGESGWLGGVAQIGEAIKGVDVGLGALAERVAEGFASTVTGRGFRGDPVDLSFPSHTRKETYFLETAMPGAHPFVIREIASRTFDWPKEGPINDPVMLREMKETREAKRLLKMARSFAKQPGTLAKAISEGIFSFGMNQPPLTPNEISRMHPALALFIDITSAAPLLGTAVGPAGSVLTRVLTRAALPQVTAATKRAFRTGAVDVGRFGARLFDPLTDPVTAQLGGGRFLRLVPDPDPRMAKTVLPATEPLPSTNVIGMQPIQPGLTRGEQIWNLVRRVTRKPVDHELITPAMKEQARVIPNIASAANLMAQKWRFGINSVFDINKKGQIENLAGIDPALVGGGRASRVADLSPTRITRPAPAPARTADVPAPTTARAVAGRKRTVEELLEAGGYKLPQTVDEVAWQASSPPPGSPGTIPGFAYSRTLKQIQEKIDHAVREQGIYRSIEGKAQRHFDDLDEFSSREVEFLEDLVPDKVVNQSYPPYPAEEIMTFSDIKAAVRKEIREAESTIQYWRAQITEKTELDLAAREAAMQRGVARIGLEEAAPTTARTALTPDEVTELARLKGQLARDEAALEDLLNDVEYTTKFPGAKPRPYSVRQPGAMPGYPGYRPPLARTAAQRAEDIVDAEDAVRAAKEEVASAKEAVDETTEYLNQNQARLLKQGKSGKEEIASLKEDIAEAKSNHTNAKNDLTEANADLKQAKKATGYTAADEAYIAAADKLDVKYPKDLRASIQRAQKDIDALEARQAAPITPATARAGAPATALPGAAPAARVVAGTPLAPTIQDVAARLPVYRRYLNDKQLAMLRKLENDLKAYRQMLDEAGVEIGNRPDIMDGGFYIPRGSALKGGLDEAVSVPKTTSRTGGKRSFEKSADFDSAAAGIDAGYEYALIGEALEGYASTAGGRALELHIGNYLKTLRDADGKLIGLTPSDLIDPNLRNSYQKLTRQIAARRKTLAGQNVREAAAVREVTRLENVAKGTGARVAATGARATSKASPYVQEDLILAREALAQTVEEAKTFAFQAGQNIQKLRTSKMVLNSTERKLSKEIEALNDAIREGNASLEADRAKRAASTRPNLGGLSRTVGTHLKEANRLTATVNKLSVRAEKMAARVDGLIEKGDILKDMRTAEREALVTARRTERALLQKQQAMANVERELRLLTFEHRRTLRAAGRGGKRLENAQRRAMKTEQELRDFQDDKDEISVAWDKAVEKSQNIPQDQRIDLPGLQQHSFPAELAAAANKVIAEQGPLRGAGAQWIEGVKGYNRLIIGLNTTFDNSALGIQGLAALYNNPKAFNAALGVNLQAWAKGGDEVLGRFVFQFDDTARAAGRPTSSEWVADGLHFGGASIGEQQLGEGLAAGAGRLWVIRHANRAFGFFGDALRLELVDDMLRNELARGKTLQQLRNSGELARIADIANNLTGYSHKRAGGSLGELALFAPKFLQARLSTVTKAAMGLRPGATLDQRIARRSVLKMVGFAVVLTHAINYAQGRDTDMRPWVDGNPNNNFMRARIFGRDVSLLGPWDSIGKAIMLTAMGRPQDALRSLASPIVRQAWDLSSGETTVGERTRESGRGLANLASEKTAYYMMKAVSPFSLQDLPEAGKQLAEGDIAEGAFAIGMEGIGLKSGPLGFIDQKEEARRRLFPDVAEEDLNKAQRRAILAEPAVQKKLEELDEKRPPSDVREVIAMAFDNVDIIKAETEESLRANIDAFMDGPDLRNQISKFKQRRFLETKGALNHPVVQEELEKKDANQQVEDILAEMYWSADAPEDAETGDPDFDQRDADREEVLREARDLGISESYITGTGSETYRGERYADPVVREMVMRFEEDRESVREYLEAGKDIADEQGDLPLYREYLASNDREGFLEQNPVLNMTIDMIEGRKERLRKPQSSDPVVLAEALRLERILYKWGWIDAPINLVLEIEVAMLKQQQGGEVTNRLAIDR